LETIKSNFISCFGFVKKERSQDEPALPPVFPFSCDLALNNADTFCDRKKIGLGQSAPAKSQLWEQIRNRKYGNLQGANIATDADKSGLYGLQRRINLNIT
jgi:hypothetical protein